MVGFADRRVTSTRIPLLTMQFGGTSFAMTAPAVATDPKPTRTPGVIVAFAPIQTLDSITIGAVVIPSNRSFGSTG